MSAVDGNMDQERVAKKMARGRRQVVDLLRDIADRLDCVTDEESAAAILQIAPALGMLVVEGERVLGSLGADDFKSLWLARRRFGSVD